LAIEPTDVEVDAAGLKPMLGAASFFPLKLPSISNHKPPVEPLDDEGATVNLEIDLLPPIMVRAPYDKGLLLLASCYSLRSALVA
jgi:hypothetical protein